MEKEKYYLIDTRQVVGNSMLFWRKNNAGYTTKVEEAEIYTHEEAHSRSENRETDVPIAVSMVEKLKSPTVDIQDYQRAKEGVV